MSDNRRKGADIVRKALARALFDAAPEIVHSLGRTVYEPGLKYAAEELLARAVVDEMDHSGWEMASARDCPAESSRIRKRLCLDSHVEFGINLVPILIRAQLVSEDRARAGSARQVATDKIVDTFELMRVRLAHRPRS